LGGGGFAFDECAVLLEEAGRSLLGPLALNCSAPDEGNIHLISLIGTEEQKRKYLLPLVAGDIRIYDGASEVHRMSIARRAARRARSDGSDG
ncbi:MAG TPA: acyl-CoA dehydrogenase family protein, partial [Trebonia sp.]